MRVRSSCFKAVCRKSSVATLYRRRVYYSDRSKVATLPLGTMTSSIFLLIMSQMKIVMYLFFCLYSLWQIQQVYVQLVSQVSIYSSHSTICCISSTHEQTVCSVDHEPTGIYIQLSKNWHDKVRTIQTSFFFITDASLLCLIVPNNKFDFQIENERLWSVFLIFASKSR